MPCPQGLHRLKFYSVGVDALHRPRIHHKLNPAGTSSPSYQMSGAILLKYHRQVYLIPSPLKGEMSKSLVILTEGSLHGRLGSRPLQNFHKPCRGRYPSSTDELAQTQPSGYKLPFTKNLSAILHSAFCTLHLHSAFCIPHLTRVWKIMYNFYQ